MIIDELIKLQKDLSNIRREFQEKWYNPYSGRNANMALSELENAEYRLGMYVDEFKSISSNLGKQQYLFVAPSELTKAIKQGEREVTANKETKPSCN